ncbi:hypothetical protein C8Q74DRAFT_575000 [Fomes fomentarius]|nr:hypothetical protein C8Q74DRAFT_575000 [Fomes fomentarius]
MLRSTPSFPTEIFLAIKHAIHPYDLRTHVCFYLSSREIAGLYDVEQDPDGFWELACWHCGIGMLPSDEDSRRPWKDIAIECIKRDGFCTLPWCGESMLCFNRWNMTQASQHLDLAPLEVFLDADPEVTLNIHPALETIRFATSRGPLLRDALSSPGTVFTGDVNTALGTHPLLCRSFATSAPTAKLMLRPIAGRLLSSHALSRENAITVFDVVKAIHDDLDTPMSVKEVCMFLDLHEDCLPAKVTRSIRAPFQHLQTLRNLLSTW